MKTSLFLASQLLAAGLASQPFLNEVDTGLETRLQFLGNWTEGTQPELREMRSLQDFDFAARQKLKANQYAYYRLGAGQEWSYRNNLDIWQKVRFRPRFLRDITKLNDSIGIELFGHKFSAPFFIAPAANAAHCDPERAELNLMEAAGDADILYTAALLAAKTIEELAVVKRNNTLNGPQVAFQQIYTQNNLSVTFNDLKRAEAAGAKAIVWTVDTPSSSVRIRSARYTSTEAGVGTTRPNTWDTYAQLKNHTKLPIILKGIQSVEDAIDAVEHKVDGIYISNHGGRQLEYAPSSLEVAYEIYRNAPQVFNSTVILADSGVRSGNDILKLMALGVHAVGLGRPYVPGLL